MEYEVYGNKGDKQNQYRQQEGNFLEKWEIPDESGPTVKAFDQ